MVETYSMFSVLFKFTVLVFCLLHDQFKEKTQDLLIYCIVSMVTVLVFCLLQYQFKQKAQILIFPRLAMSDKGRYMCVISNSEGSLNWTFTLKVICK